MEVNHVADISAVLDASKFPGRRPITLFPGEMFAHDAHNGIDMNESILKKSA